VTDLGKISAALKQFKNPLVAWSGGKDSVFVSETLKKIGKYKYACVVSRALEYQMHLDYISAYAFTNQLSLAVIETGFDFDWLNQHPEFILPVSSAIRAKIYKVVQQNHIKFYAENNGHDAVIFGRRTDDGNSIYAELYKNKNGKGIFQYFPFKDVKDNEVMSALKNVELSPIYQKCDGFARGTHTVNICNAYGDTPIGKRLEFVKRYEPKKYNELMKLIKIHKISV